MVQLMDLKVDYAFKQLFGSPGNERILITFLNAVLRCPKGKMIQSVQIKNPELNPWQDLLARWLLLLGAVNREEVEEDILNDLEKIATEGDLVMKEAIKKWEDLSSDTESKARYLSHLKAMIDEWSEAREAEKRYQAAKEQGLEQGIEQGKKENALFIARNLLDKGMAPKEIAEITQLSKEEIERL